MLPTTAQIQQIIEKHDLIDWLNVTDLKRLENSFELSNIYLTFKDTNKNECTLCIYFDNNCSIITREDGTKWCRYQFVVKLNWPTHGDNAIKKADELLTFYGKLLTLAKEIQSLYTEIIEECVFTLEDVKKKKHNETIRKMLSEKTVKLRKNQIISFDRENNDNLIEGEHLYTDDTALAKKHKIIVSADKVSIQRLGNKN